MNTIFDSYYLHFSEPVSIDEVKDVFSFDDFSVEINQIFPSSFALQSKLSFSAIRNSLCYFYTEMHDSRTYVIIKAKRGSLLYRSDH